MKEAIHKHTLRAAGLVDYHPYLGQRATNMRISLLVNKRGIVVSHGFNQPKTHPYAVKLGYRYGQVHSELNAIQNYDGEDTLRTLTMFNFRFNHNRELRISRPCVHCMPWVLNTVKQIVYSMGPDSFESIHRNGDVAFHVLKG